MPQTVQAATAQFMDWSRLDFRFACLARHTGQAVVRKRRLLRNWVISVRLFCRSARAASPPGVLVTPPAAATPSRLVSGLPRAAAVFRQLSDDTPRQGQERAAALRAANCFACRHLLRLTLSLPL